MASSLNTPWTDAELASAVEGYVYLLRIERAGLAYSKESGANVLLSTQLKARNDASLRYRMRNISAVVGEFGAPILSAYSPAQQVGTNVRIRLRKLLSDHAGFNQILEEIGAKTASSPPTVSSKDRALDHLEALRLQIDRLEREIVGIGHNQPPEPLSDDGPQRSDFEAARAHIEALKIELKNQSPDGSVARNHTSGLIDFGLKVVAWIGVRATKFTDISLAVLAPVAVAEATGLTHELIEALKAVMAAVAH